MDHKARWQYRGEVERVAEAERGIGTNERLKGAGPINRRPGIARLPGFFGFKEAGFTFFQASCLKQVSYNSSALDQMLMPAGLMTTDPPFPQSRTREA